MVKSSAITNRLSIAIAGPIIDYLSASLRNDAVIFSEHDSMNQTE